MQIHPASIQRRIDGGVVRGGGGRGGDIWSRDPGAIDNSGGRSRDTRPRLILPNTSPSSHGPQFHVGPT